MEDDIQQYISESFEDYKKIYGFSIKEIVWTMDFLLSNPHVSANEEIEELKVYLTKLEQLTDVFQTHLWETYERNLLRQLPAKIKDDFYSKIHLSDYYIHLIDDLGGLSYNPDFQDFWLPFEDFDS